MSVIFICKHHTFYGHYDHENEDIALVTSDEEKARSWCNAFRPVVKSGETCEWRSYTKTKIDHDYSERNIDEWSDEKFNVKIPKHTYSTYS